MKERVRNDLEKEEQIEIGVGYMCGGEKTEKEQKNVWMKLRKEK